MPYFTNIHFGFVVIVFVNDVFRAAAIIVVFDNVDKVAVANAAAVFVGIVVVAADVAVVVIVAVFRSFRF